MTGSTGTTGGTGGTGGTNGDFKDDKEATDDIAGPDGSDDVKDDESASAGDESVSVDDKGEGSGDMGSVAADDGSDDKALESEGATIEDTIEDVKGSTSDNQGSSGKGVGTTVGSEVASAGDIKWVGLIVGGAGCAVLALAVVGLRKWTQVARLDAMKNIDLEEGVETSEEMEASAAQ